MARRFAQSLQICGVLTASACGTAGGEPRSAPADASAVVLDSGAWASRDGAASKPPSGLTTDDAGSPPTPADSGTGSGYVHRDGGPFSNIEHVVLIVQENHTFDTYFGSYCTALPGSNPSCNLGPSCCESAPSRSPGDAGMAATALTDSTNGTYDPNHTQACELTEINGGAMDRFTSGSSVSSCSNTGNFAIAAPATVQGYQTLAASYALADRYFQPIAGESSSNDMYLAVAQHVFTDNAYQPDTSGQGCDDVPVTPTITYSAKTIADVLIGGGFSFHTYFEGYAAMLAATLCPSAPPDCPMHVPYEPCVYEPTDNPFQYYAQFADNLTYQKDWTELQTDLAAGTLPNFSYVKHLQFKNEHPGYGTTISVGMGMATADILQVLESSLSGNTLVLLTWDEGGGFFDHVPPPPTSTIDNQPYGMRIPMLALGRFAKKNYISHVTMEHSSVIRFLEQNFLGTAGQLSARDGTVNSIWDLLDETQTGASFE